MTIDLDWLDGFFDSAFVKADDDVGYIRVQETATASETESVVTMRSRYGHASTTTATPLDIDLGSNFVVANGQVWGLDAYVTAKGTAKRKKVKISALIYGSGSTATLDDDPDVDEKGNDADITATIVVSGAKPYLRLTGIDLALSWGWEVRAQIL